jgi:anti-anti-sigma factor
MRATVTSSGERARIALEGRFDFNANHAFRDAYEAVLGSEAQTIEIDFEGVEYLDSSALGMLLLLRDQASERQQSVELANCRGIVGQVLEIANFRKLFAIR